MVSVCIAHSVGSGVRKIGTANCSMVRHFAFNLPTICYISHQIFIYLSDFSNTDIVRRTPYGTDDLAITDFW